ncbi:MAG: hypothetical protein DWQ18_09265 [Crenarchaeota archaeon]|nr:MAG: hypothetical protein DWQ17_00520 [Thermoproteota archaeon]RDJ33317.1 MAG: hypothetical protein DWQ18_09265 [Thermoproteota archaeon]RDJ36180.1 MAG: hypothetical protein DWQ19_06055 [Thermoproteota archaeon]RDJ38811.1 MAG: hypothetical protein DWQ13_00520 [Thermoproteota archaeon]
MTTLIIVEDFLDIEQLNSKNHFYKADKIFTLNFQSHNKLNEMNIQHEIGELLLSKEDKIKAFDTTISLKTWYRNHPHLSELTLQNLNIIEIFDSNELQQLLLDTITKLLTIKEIIKKNNPTRILASETIGRFIRSIPFSSSIHLDLFQKSNYNSLFFDKYQIHYKIGPIPLTFNLSRNTLMKLKTWYEKIIAVNYNLFNYKEHQKKILFLEFDPIKYEDLLNELNKLNITPVLLNRRKSAIWNSKAISIIKKYDCKLINESYFLPQKKLFNETVNNLKMKLEKFWTNTEFFDEMFTIDDCHFWQTLEETLKRVYQKRLEEYVKLIIISNGLLNKFHFNCIVSLYATGETENAILKLNNNRISNILLEHGYANFVDEVSRYDVLHMYDVFMDKIGVWGKIEKDYLTDCRKISENRILLTGNPRHDIFFRTKRNLSIKNRVLIIPSPIVNYSGLTDTDTYLRYDKIIKNLMSILNKYHIDVIVKLHPTQDSSNNFIKNIFLQINKNIKIYHMSSILDHLKNVDSVIHIEPHGVGLSTSILESLILNIPTMNIVIKNEIYQFDCVKKNAILSLKDIDIVDEKIHNFLFDKKLRKNLIKNGQNHVFEYLANPGKSSIEFAKILKLLAN